jgi:hypothetical protein
MAVSSDHYTKHVNTPRGQNAEFFSVRSRQYSTSKSENSFAFKTANSGILCLWRERGKVSGAAWGRGAGARLRIAVAFCSRSAKRDQVLAAVSMHGVLAWILTPCSQVGFRMYDRRWSSMLALKLGKKLRRCTGSLRRRLERDADIVLDVE